jgi:hypothetical protein
MAQVFRDKIKRTREFRMRALQLLNPTCVDFYLLRAQLHEYWWHNSSATDTAKQCQRFAYRLPTGHTGYYSRHASVLFNTRWFKTRTYSCELLMYRFNFYNSIYMKFYIHQGLFMLFFFFALTPLANLHIVICALSFPVQRPLAGCGFSNANSLFLWEYPFLFPLFFFKIATGTKTSTLRT